MDVIERLGMRVDDLASDCGVADEALVARVLEVTGATRSPGEWETTQSESHDDDRPPETERSGRVPPKEIVALQRQARQGQPHAARRVAELLELDENMHEARKWWVLAAEMGDEDAIAYVEYVLHNK